MAPDRSFVERADLKACCPAFFGNLQPYFRGTGGKTTPPPTQIGERLLPCRARPVPFWRQGLAPPPRTSLRTLALAVPNRREANCITTARWRRDLFIFALKTTADRVISPVSSPSI